MPSSPDDIDFEAISSPYSQRLSAAPSISKMERNVSEPSPRLLSQSPPLSSAAMHLLTVPHAPVLTKQHSAPSQSICDTQFSYHRQEAHTHFTLHRQLSLPSAHSPPPDRVDPFTIAEEKEVLSGSSVSHSVRPSVSTESKSAHNLSPTFVVVAEPTEQAPPPLRVRSEELQRSVSSPQVCFELLLSIERTNLIIKSIHVHFVYDCLIYCHYVAASIARDFIGESLSALSSYSAGTCTWL